MSTTTLNPTAAPTATLPSRAIIRRFVWKEYRVLRGLWLAVAVLGVLVQAALNVLLPPQSDHALTLFIVAWGAAVLYAAGAAAATFSVEHEEETYGFLSGLPTTWWPMFVGKLTVAALSAFALAAALAITGGTFHFPTAQNAAAISAACSVAILEAIAWGTLFSLLIKRPLVAALLTLIVGGMAMHVAVNLSSSSTVASLNLNSYLAAIPIRLAIVAAVLALSAAVARRWLPTNFSSSTHVGQFLRNCHLQLPSSIPRGEASGEGSSKFRGLLSSLSAHIATPIRSISTRATCGASRRMTARLLWQTWSESWLWLPLPIFVGFVLTAGTALMTYLTQFSNETESLLIASTLFVTPTLYGAMAFSADQRRGSYRFLAEHAARPRYVWLARHAVWLGAACCVMLTATTFLMTVLGRQLLTYLDYFVRENDQSQTWISRADDPVHVLLTALSATPYILALAAGGTLTAYALGQFWSMLMRSEIIAAFTALVLSVGLAAWVALLFVWDLPGRLFLLPLFVGLMFATWFRAPAWIADRQTWRAWLAPALAVAATLALVGVALPIVRVSQLPMFVGPHVNYSPDVAIDSSLLQPIPADEKMTKAVDSFRAADTPAARETAAMYLRAADLLDSMPGSELLERWQKPGLGYRKDDRVVGSFIDRIVDSRIDIAKIPADERAAFREASQSREQLMRKAIESAVELATEASSRSSCRFDFHIDQALPIRDQSNWRRQLDLDSVPAYQRLNTLLDYVWYTYTGASSQDRLDHSRTALRISAHIRSGQPSVVLIDQLRRERQILNGIGQLAFRDDVTNDQLRETIDQLESYFRSLYSPVGALLADLLIINDVLQGKTYPLALTKWANSNAAYLAFLANQLPWELERGERALNLITQQNIRDANELTGELLDQQPREFRTRQLRCWLRPDRIESDRSPNWLIQQPASATSYLTRFEYQARVRLNDLYRAICDTEVYRRATLLHLALAMYRRDHDTYPKTLAELVPDYLVREPLDPYTNQSFQYHPAGLDLPLEPDHRARHERIQPHTPLFWSVGVGNARLRQQMNYKVDENNYRIDEDKVDADGRPQYGITETVYLLRAEDSQWWNEPNFVFPLPK